MSDYAIDSPENAIRRLKEWAQAARDNPPPSGPFLADDLELCIAMLDDEFYSSLGQPQVNGYSPPVSPESNERTKRTKAKRKRQKERWRAMERARKVENRSDC